MICINALQSNDEHECMKKELYHLWDTKVAAGKRFDSATMRAYVSQYWKQIKENRKLTYRLKGNNGGQNGQPGQGGQGEKIAKPSGGQKRMCKDKDNKSDNC